MIEKVINLLKEKNITLSSCESLTGGKFSSLITSYPGVSSFFKGGLVTYATSVKHDVLGINQTLIDRVGVVSEEVAYKMCLESARLLKSDLSISFTGNAGPSSMEGKEVGLVYIGLYYKEKVKVYECHFKGDREEIRNASIKEGIRLIYENILGNLSKDC